MNTLVYRLTSKKRKGSKEREREREGKDEEREEKRKKKQKKKELEKSPHGTSFHPKNLLAALLFIQI